MPDYYTNPDARSSLVPLLCGLSLGGCLGLAVGLLVGVKWAGG